MPVYGLPLSLEASLNSLIELRPPVSWRVSGHGNDITVVLRWTLSGSPSSDRTFDYDIDHRPKSSVGLATSHMWPRGLKRHQDNSPGTEIKTRCSSTHDCQINPSIHSKCESTYQPLKLRKVETITQFSPTQSCPVPVYITVSDNALLSPSIDGQATHPSAASCDNSQIKDQSSEKIDLTCQQESRCQSQIKKLPEAEVTCSSETQNLVIDLQSPNDDLHMCLTLSDSETSSDAESVILDEKNGLFSRAGNDLAIGKENLLDVIRPRSSEHVQNDSGCASESNSTSLSHYVKHTLSQDSSSQDYSHYKSPNGVREDADRISRADQRCSSSGSTSSRSSFSLHSCSSKSKTGSVATSNENSNLPPDKDDDCHTNDLDMACSNGTEINQRGARSVSTRSSISYWDSFDSIQSELLEGEGEQCGNGHRDITNDSL